jgi:hypothetical protein
MSGLPDASEEFATVPPMIDGRVAAALDCAAPAAASDSAASDSAATPTTVASARVVEHLIILDFEGTCDPSDERLTRLQQCDIHEIIEFPAVWISARGENAGTEIDFFREYVKPVEGAAEGKAREISAFCECRSRATHALGTLNSELCHVLTTVPRALLLCPPSFGPQPKEPPLACACRSSEATPLTGACRVLCLRAAPSAGVPPSSSQARASPGSHKLTSIAPPPSMLSSSAFGSGWTSVD